MTENTPAKPLNFAVLIDADNASPLVFSEILSEVAKIGEVTVKRIYGDFSSPHSTRWTDVIHKHAVMPRQQFAFTKGKNATDILLVIDAMDLLHTGRFDGFCLVSSDSDFTSLAMRLRDGGVMVVGFGEKKAPEAFRNACQRFVFTEVLRDAINAPATGEAKTGDELQEPVFPDEFFLAALAQAKGDAEWVNLGAYGTHLIKLRSDFDPRLLRYDRLISLVKARSDLFVLKYMRLGNGARVPHIKEAGAQL